MRLTKSTDLALRIVMSLAAIGEESTTTIRKIAEAMEVPYSHLTKVAAQLQHLGLVESRRGAVAACRSPRAGGGRPSAAW